MAVNAYNGWYTPDKLSDLASFVWRSPYKKPLILSEFGAGALAGEHDPARTHKFSEEFQADYYRAMLDMASKIPFLRGMYTSIIKEFRSTRRQQHDNPQGWKLKGYGSETEARKKAVGGM